MPGKLHVKDKAERGNEISTPTSSVATLSPAGSTVPPRLLETCIDNSQSCQTDVRDSTLEVLVGTIMTEDGSYHLSSPYPASNNSTFTLSTTRDRKTSDATTISGSLPRDESSFHNAEEFHSEIISEEVFDEAVKSSPSDMDTAHEAV